MITTRIESSRYAEVIRSVGRYFEGDGAKKVSLKGVKRDDMGSFRSRGGEYVDLPSFL